MVYYSSLSSDMVRAIVARIRGKEKTMPGSHVCLENVDGDTVTRLDGDIVKFGHRLVKNIYIYIYIWNKFCVLLLDCFLTVFSICFYYSVVAIGYHAY